LQCGTQEEVREDAPRFDCVAVHDFDLPDEVDFLLLPAWGERGRTTGEVVDSTIIAGQKTLYNHMHRKQNRNLDFGEMKELVLWRCQKDSEKISLVTSKKKKKKKKKKKGQT
jgi:hypothetical protein